MQHTKTSGSVETYLSPLRLNVIISFSPFSVNFLLSDWLTESRLSAITPVFDLICQQPRSHGICNMADTERKRPVPLPCPPSWNEHLMIGQYAEIQEVTSSAIPETANYNQQTFLGTGPLSFDASAMLLIDFNRSLDDDGLANKSIQPLLYLTYTRHKIFSYAIIRISRIKPSVSGLPKMQTTLYEIVRRIFLSRSVSTRVSFHSKSKHRAQNFPPFQPNNSCKTN